jgi:hypothetical protein
MLFAGLWLASGSGCAAPERPDPAEAFDELCKRSLADDAAYVRARLSPSFTEAADCEGSGIESPEFITDIMQLLRLCRGRSWRKTDRLDRVVVEGVGLSLPGAVSRFSVDMVYDREVGWQLARPPYGVRRLQPQGGRNESERMKDDG